MTCVGQVSVGHILFYFKCHVAGVDNFAALPKLAAFKSFALNFITALNYRARNCRSAKLTALNCRALH